MERIQYNPLLNRADYNNAGKQQFLVSHVERDYKSINNGDNIKGKVTFLMYRAINHYEYKFFYQLEEIAVNSGKRLADVFRFVSFKPFEKFGPHQHVRIEINYVKKGTASLGFENESVCFSENEIMIVCSNVKHSFEVEPKNYSDAIGIFT